MSENSTGEDVSATSPAPACDGATCSIAEAPPAIPVVGDQSGDGGGKEAKEQRQHTPSKKKKKKATTSSFSHITTLHSQQDFDAFLSTNDAVIVEFMTDWCGACKSVEEYYDDLAAEFSSVDGVITCAKIQCDKNKQTKKVAVSYNVKSYPVFAAFRGGSLATRFDGADKGKLEAMFERLDGGGGGGKMKGKKGKGKGIGRSNKRK